ncbi:MAG: hypothetical protein NVS1B12_11280 [Acidimicrobiales bacterium]
MTSVHTDPTETVPVHEMVEASGPDAIWDDELPTRPVRQKVGRLTLGLLVIAFAAGAFYAGVVTEKHSLGSTATAARTRAATRGASATPAATPGGAGGGGAGGATVGQVKLIDGSNIYVTDSTGNVVKVATTSASQITVTSSGTVKDVKPGDTVIVTGPTGSDGTVSATAVRDSGAGGAGFGGFGGRPGRTGAAGAGAAGTSGAGAGGGAG